MQRIPALLLTLTATALLLAPLAAIHATGRNVS